jgi:hypothetical protein
MTEYYTNLGCGLTVSGYDNYNYNNHSRETSKLKLQIAIFNHTKALKVLDVRREFSSSRMSVPGILTFRISRAFVLYISCA